MHRFAALLLTTACLLAGAAPARAAGSLVITGAGFGHGIGMSQYGSLGYAQHGWHAPQILAHYYTGTSLATLTSTPAVRVLLASGRTSFTIHGAAEAGGRPLDSSKTYVVTSGGNGAIIRAQGARAALTAAPPLTVLPAAGGAVKLDGLAINGLAGGSYRGALEFRPAGPGLQAVNALGLEQYVAGVISAEVPASWPTEALRTQAIAARTYALTTNAGGSQGFTQYADTRSQMYRGVSAETPATSAAVRDTARQVVTYRGQPVTTYFFSSSGGRTENVENVFVGADPKPWLKSVADPYDTVSPSHRWGPIRMSLSEASAKLGSLIKGRLRWVRVLKRGVSPRIVQAQLVGTSGTTDVTGPQLRRAFGLRDSWMRFRSFSTDLTVRRPATPGSPVTGGTPSGSAGAARVHVTSRVRQAISGSIRPDAGSTWARVERLSAGRWTLAADVLLDARGRFDATLPGPGRYRVTWRDATGPEITAR